MKTLSYRNIANIVLIIMILVLSYLEVDTINKNSNGIMLIGVIDALVVLLLVINLLSKRTIVKEVVKEVYVNDTNIETGENTEIFEMLDDKEETNNLVITSKEKDQNPENYVEKQLINLSKQINIAQAVFYIKNDNNIFEPISTYAFYSENEISSIKEGEGIIGQAIKDKKMLSIDEIPDGYITIISGLGSGNPKSLLIVPALIDNNVVAVAEIASLNKFTEEQKNIINEAINKISANIINVH
jgi:two-component system chemotaxis sensor kinase CheA